ncbi:MAG: hypothetical protein ABI488_17555 [Polyangiaceae bacterium]
MKPQEFRLACRSLSGCAVLFYAFSACSSGTTGHPSMIDDSGGGRDATAGGSGSVDHSGGHAADAGASGEGSEVGGSAGGSAGDGGHEDAGSPPLETGGSAPMAGPAACSQLAKWGAPSAVDGVSTAATETLLSVTLDELDLAFVRAGVLYVAHRDSQSAAFGAVAPIMLPAGWTAKQGAALSADGKRLVLVSDPDQRKLGELVRASRDQTFSGDVDESAFEGVNQDAVYTGRIYAAPVVSAGDDQLIFNSTFPESASTVVYSTRTGGSAWNPPRQLQPQLLDGDSTTRRLPTGLSADGRTLFYFNEETMQEEGRWRNANTVSSPLYDIVSLGLRRGATPNTACNRLYSDANGALVVEKD